MGSFVRMWVLPVAGTVAAWRALSELVARTQELAATGELARRVEARRATLLAGELARAGVRTPVRVPVLAGPDMRTMASVQAGVVGRADVDDVGLLEGAMRRAVSDRMHVSASGVQRSAERRARRAAQRGETRLAADVLSSTPAQPRPTSVARVAPVRTPRRDGGWTDWRFLEGDESRAESIERTLTWQLPAVLCGAVVTFAPLVRPLAEAAPWLAITGLALVSAGWLGARRA